MIYHSSEYYSYVNRAMVVVDNYTGLRSFGFRNFKSSWLHRIVNKKNQFCISTWHGTPLKKIGKDIKTQSIKDYYSCTDYCVAGCKYTADILEHSYCFYNKIKLYGTPRNDLLFQENIDVSALKRKLHLPEDKKIVLFAPSFRDSVDMSGVAQMKMFDIVKMLNELTNTLQQKEGYVIAFRVHHSVLEKINSVHLINDYKDIVFDGNVGDDMAEYLKCTDVLITDYSGSLFDFALTKKPCFLFAPDRKHYEEIERGFYMDYHSLPFPISENFSELLDCIRKFSAKEYEGKITSFLNVIGNAEDGHASERVAVDINNFLTTNKKQDMWNIQKVQHYA